MLETDHDGLDAFTIYVAPQQNLKRTKVDIITSQNAERKTNRENETDEAETK